MTSTARTPQVAVVAGGSAGVGRAVARRLAEAGWQVAVIARGRGRLETAEAELDAYDGVEARHYPCDVADAAALDAVAGRIESDLGPIGVWINSAMMTSFSPFSQMTAAEFQRILDTTFLGTVNGTRAALAVMAPRGRGRIVNVGSGLGYRSVPFQSAYCAAKHATNGFTAAVRSELLREGSGIALSLVQLPAIDTPQFDWARNRLESKPQPAPPIYDPDVAARAVMRAVRTGTREILVGQSVLKLVLGQLFFPDRLDRTMARDGAEMQKSPEEEPGGRADNLAEPVARDVAARGRFGRRALDRAAIVDGDRARALLLGALLGVAGLAGLGIGLTAALA